MKKRVHPFSNGTEYMDWLGKNCARCKKGYDYESGGESKCDIEKALSFAAVDDGTITAEIAKRMGHSDPLAYTWDCPEREEAQE